MDAGHEAGTPAIDWTVMDDLVEQIGDPDIPAALVAAYLEELPDRRADLVATRDGEAPALRAAAHGLGSASLTIGALPLGQACREVEAAIDAGDLAAARATCDRVLEWIDRVGPALQQRYPG